MERECALVLSPNGRKELLAVTASIVAQAPELEGWEFHGSKPPKRWTRRVVELQRESGETVEVDLDRWRYSLVGYDGFAFFDVTFVLPANATLDPSLALRAAWVLLDGEFGEREALERFAGVRVLAQHEAVDLDRSSDVEVLREHVESLRVRER